MTTTLEATNLQRLIPTYRRDTDDITGAVRMSSVEMVSMEQMPGGRFQITVRTNGGSEYFITPVLANLHIGREGLEAFRARLSGEEPMYPVPAFMPANLNPASQVDGGVVSNEPEPVVEAGPDLLVPEEARGHDTDPGEVRPLQFTTSRTWRRARSRHRNAPGRDVRSWTYHGPLEVQTLQVIPVLSPV